MLKHIRIDNFRTFVNFEAEFGPERLLIGSNGAGKSSLFDVLGLIRDFCIRGEAADRRHPDPRFVGPTRTRWYSDEVREQTFEMTVTGNGGEYRLLLIMDSWGNPERPRVLREELTFDRKPIFYFEKGEVSLFNDQFDQKVKYPFDWYRSALATITERPENTRLSWFKRWLDGLLVVAPEPRRMSNIAEVEAKRPDQSLANFADWYRHIRLDTDDREYLADLAEIFDGFDRLRFEDAGERRRELKACFRFRNERGAKSNSEYLLSELSDGQRVLISLYAVLHFALKPGTTICFDEPDNFISIREIEPWLRKVLDREEEKGGNSQVLIASHNSEILNRMAFENGLRLHRPEGRATVIEPFRDPAATGLPAAELMARGWEG